MACFGWGAGFGCEVMDRGKPLGEAVAYRGIFRQISRVGGRPEARPRLPAETAPVFLLIPLRTRKMSRIMAVR